MELEQLKLLSPEQKDKYMRLERLFEQPGWDDIERWALVNRMASAERQLNAQNWDQNRVAHGARLAFEMLENLKAATEHEFEALAADAQQAAEIDDSLENE